MGHIRIGNLTGLWWPTALPTYSGRLLASVLRASIISIGNFSRIVYNVEDCSRSYAFQTKSFRSKNDLLKLQRYSNTINVPTNKITSPFPYVFRFLRAVFESLSITSNLNQVT